MKQYQGTLGLEGSVLSVDFTKQNQEFHVPLEADDIVEIKNEKNEIIRCNYIIFMFYHSYILQTQIYK